MSRNEGRGANFGVWRVLFHESEVRQSPTLVLSTSMEGKMKPTGSQGFTSSLSVRLPLATLAIWERWRIRIYRGELKAEVLLRKGRERLLEKG